MPRPFFHNRSCSQVLGRSYCVPGTKLCVVQAHQILTIPSTVRLCLGPRGPERVRHLPEVTQLVVKAEPGPVPVSRTSVPDLAGEVFCVVHAAIKKKSSISCQHLKAGRFTSKSRFQSTPDSLGAPPGSCRPGAAPLAEVCSSAGLVLTRMMLPGSVAVGK